MNQIYIPEGYRPVLDEYDTQRAIAYIKQTFQIPKEYLLDFLASKSFICIAVQSNRHKWFNEQIRRMRIDADK